MTNWKESQIEPNRHYAQLGVIKLIVERRNGHPPDVWVAWSAPAMIAEVALKAKELDAAKAEAVELLRRKCAAVVRACE